MERFRVRVNEQICIGAGVCEEMMAEAFKMNDLGVAETPALVYASRRRLIDVAEGCPMRAITVIDADTDEQLFP
jgi:ferredoxin